MLRPSLFRDAQRIEAVSSSSQHPYINLLLKLSLIPFLCTVCAVVYFLFFSPIIFITSDSSSNHRSFFQGNALDDIIRHDILNEEVCDVIANNTNFKTVNIPSSARVICYQPSGRGSFPIMQERFINRVKAAISHKIIFKSCGLDWHIDKDSEALVKWDNLYKWYLCQPAIVHEKQVVMPLGVMKKHMDVLSKYRDDASVPPEPGTKLAYASFGLKNDERKHLYSLCNSTYFDFCTSVTTQKREIHITGDGYKRMLEQPLILSPAGRGIDCHRTWESLYLNRVPVVLKREVMQDVYRGLPIIEVDSWDDLTQEQLKKELSAVRAKSSLEKATVSFWKKHINQTKESMLDAERLKN